MLYFQMYTVGLLLCLSMVLCKLDSFKYNNNPSVALLQRYIQINTTAHNNLGAAVKFWTKLAVAEKVEIKKYTYKKNLPILVLEWPGTNPTLFSVMLNSHMDVVPASAEDGWLYPPFSGHITEDGKFYGRGTQDMKSVSIQYYLALQRIKEKKVSLLRTVYMTLMPDEEEGGEFGMMPFLQSKKFKAMNVGVSLDEGAPVNIPEVPVFYQDKVAWQIRVNCYGTTEHGSAFQPTNITATGKCDNVVSNLFRFRDEQFLLFMNAPIDDAGVYTSLNLNKMAGGTANNVVPRVVSLTFDIRLNTRLNLATFQEKLESLIYSAGDNITITYLSKNPQSPATVANSSNPFWTAIEKTAEEMNIKVLPVVPPGSTDARHVRLAGVPAFGISPKPNTPTLLHAVDEHISVDTFLNGIDFYEKLIYNMANIPADAVTDPSSFLYNTTTG